MEIQRLENRIEEILHEVKTELVYSKDADKSPVGMTLSELNKTKQIPLKSSCQNLFLYIAGKLYDSGINCQFVLMKRGKCKHFCLQYMSDGKVKYIDEYLGKLYILDSLKTEDKIIEVSGNYNGEESIMEVFAHSKIIQIGLTVRNLIFPLLPRQWPLKYNEMKDHRREELFNKRWNKNLTT